MSYYDDRRTSTRDRRRDTDYYDDAVYTNTRENQRSTAIVKRRSDSPEYDEEVRRDFSPGGGGYYRETITRKSGVRPAGRARSQEDRFDDDRSMASSRRDSYYGARRDRGYGDKREKRDNRRSRYEESDSSRSRSRTPPKRERRKSMPEEALEALGLGGVLAAITGKKSRSRSRSGDRSRSGREKSPNHGREQATQALKAAILAGAGAAFLARKEEGGWTGDKGKRVLTAAFTAGGVDGFINRDKNPEEHKLRDTIGAAVAGLAANRVVNGPPSRSQSRRGSPNGRNGRSQSRGVGDLLAGGAIAAAAKKAADNFRGRSQSRGRRSSSYDSRDDSRSPPRRSRSRSVFAKGLAKVGLDKQADKVDPAGARDRSRSRGPRSRHNDRYVDDDYVDDRRDSVSRSNSQNRSRSLNAQNGAMVGPGGGVISPPPPDYQYDRKPHKNGDPETDSESDIGSSSEDEKYHKKGRTRLLVSGGLASIATIHAGHSVYQSIEKRKMRKEALRDGTIDKEDAAKHKSRDRMQDAASIGLAALGIKGAYSEWKETKEQMDEDKEEKEKIQRHALKREARRKKMSLVGMTDSGYSNSAPTLSDPFYGGAGHDGQGRQQYYQGPDGPYMSGANGGMPQQPTGNTPQYYDDNPYGWMAHQQNAGNNGHQYGNNGGAFYGNSNANTNYAPQPAQGGTGFPPPPMGNPSPAPGR